MPLSPMHMRDYRRRTCLLLANMRRKVQGEISLYLFSFRPFYSHSSGMTIKLSGYDAVDHSNGALTRSQQPGSAQQVENDATLHETIEKKGGAFVVMAFLEGHISSNGLLAQLLRPDQTDQVLGGQEVFCANVSKKGKRIPTRASGFG
ncbi:hypothetical protein H107_08541 [Trichophyton rubrum CBS 202.88]|nr:hypothetical protein H102_08367 [Trichophyton rubrum CBS 100081]EZG11993.1 hypothetical protein H107_08541 [Trichophyton rubrum CBS 202.88]